MQMFLKSGELFTPYTSAQYVALIFGILKYYWISYSEDRQGATKRTHQ